MVHPTVDTQIGSLDTEGHSSAFNHEGGRGGGRGYAQIPLHRFCASPGWGAPAALL